MTEPNILSQFLGIATTMISLFIVLSLIAYGEQKAKAKKKVQEEHDKMIIEIYQQGRNQFNNIARMNIRNCDRQSTYDTQPPTGLASSLEDVPQVFRACIEDYDRLASDYQEEARNNDILRSQNANLLEENGRLLYQEMTLDFRQNPRKWRAKT